jgi:hypothetical protein
MKSLPCPSPIPEENRMERGGGEEIKKSETVWSRSFAYRVIPVYLSATNGNRLGAVK